MKARIGWLVCFLCCLWAAFASAEHADDSVRRALLIGCDAFLSHEDTTPSAALNVERMARMLQTDARGYQSVLRIDGGIAGEERLLAAIDEAFADADENDVSLLYICTHGLYDRVSYEPLLALSDGKTEQSVSAAALRAALDKVAGQKIVILDACNSGAFIGKGARDGMVHNTFVGMDYKVLTSAGAYEDSFLWRDRQNTGGSYFAQELCEGLRSRAFDLNVDGVVTLSEAYRGLLESHGASTAQVYPQQDDFALYVYDVNQEDAAERPLGEIMLDNAVLSDSEDTLYFSFTVCRPVRVQYQIVYYRNGAWRFDAPQVIEDFENRAGALVPGRKERSVTLVSEDGAPHGYVLLQIIAQEGRNAMLAGSRLIAVQPEEGDPDLRVWCDPSFLPRRGEELSVFVRHAFPCSLTVRVLDTEGALVRRLAYKTPSRPIGQRGEGSFFYWDGKDGTGEFVAAGAYIIEVQCVVDGRTYVKRSGLVSVGDYQ